MVLLEDAGSLREAPHLVEEGLLPEVAHLVEGVGLHSEAIPAVEATEKSSSSKVTLPPQSNLTSPTQT